MGAKPPAPCLWSLPAGVRPLDHHDLHFVIVVSSVEEGDARVAAQAWVLLGVLDLTQQLHDLLRGGVFRGGLALQGPLRGLHIVGEAHLLETFGERGQQSLEWCASSPLPAHQYPKGATTHHPHCQQCWAPGRCGVL